MENQAPEVILPSQKSKPNLVFWLVIGMAILTLVLALAWRVEKYSAPVSSQISSYDDCVKAKGSRVQESYPATCVTVGGQRFTQPLTDEEKQNLLPPDLNRETTGSAATANWKIYQGETIYTTDGSTTFQIKYPAEWEIEKNMLYPLGRLEDKGLETRIILGAGGHGWSGKVEKKIFPAGEANYSWVNSGQQISAFASFEKNKQTYIIEIVNLPSAYEKEYKTLFDQILSTFRFGE